MSKDEGLKGQTFSYDLERRYYSQHWPGYAKPYLQLEPYLHCWMDPEAMFKGKRILDIGAGECTYTRLIAEKFKPNKVVACDLFRERMLPVSRECRNGNLKFIAGDCFGLPFRGGVFDVVFGSLTLCQLPNLEEVVGEIRRVLSDGGCYIGIEPNPYNLVHLYRYLMGRHSPNQYLFSSKHLVQFEKYGFEIAVRYFYAKLPHFKNRLFGTCMGFIARQRN
jgi:ubiquinone/menaquinone biosynthesis C-methylase UbiE